MFAERMIPVSIFISYAHKDGKDLAVRLRADLARLGFPSWLDEQRLRAGSNWSREIEDALDRSDIVLALLSDGSFLSNVCRGEQLRSLRRGKCVIPVLVQAEAERPIYLEAQQYLDFSDPEKYAVRIEQLVRSIGSRVGVELKPQHRETHYETVPPLPSNFVPRPVELETLREAIVSDRRSRHVALLALKGMGGVGKTVLAQALCRDEAVQAAFPDGVIWVKIGEKPTDADLVGQMAEVAKALGESAEGFGTLERSSRLLRTMLRSKTVLLVLDDVWHASHVYSFQPTNGADLCRVLFTTRKSEVVASVGADSIPIGELSPVQSSQVLAAYAALGGDDLPLSARGILRECKGLPLALAMIGAMLREEPAQRWDDVLDSLQQADLENVGIEFPHYPVFEVFVAAIEVGVRDLRPELQNYYFELAVFPEDTAIPEGALATLWHLSGKAVRQVVAQFVG